MILKANRVQVVAPYAPLGTKPLHSPLSILAFSFRCLTSVNVPR